ncbi:MAG TPA: GNAT family N-acetyltransferase [Verrucomicrobiae bacterium]|nr:GNAT family N-acetyltransferase [Verrucomicrobiae bacterium]
MNPPRIRIANPADAEAIIHVHYAAVHRTAFGFYPYEILEAWSANPNEGRYQWMRNVIANSDNIVIVGEVDSCVLGFGIFVPRLEELCALYVHPDAGRRGIGKVMLQTLERRAVEQGNLCIRLNASLNAEAFYHSNGYNSLSRGKFRLSADFEMDCVKMEKHFGSRLTRG